MTTSVEVDLESGTAPGGRLGSTSSLAPPPSTINHTRTLTAEGVSLAARRDMHPTLLQRIMDTNTMRKAPWLIYVFIFLVATGIAVMCIRFRLGDDLTATIVAVLTCGLILSTGLCVWLSIRSHRQLSYSAALEAERKKKKRRITVTLKAHYYGEQLSVGALCDPGDSRLPHEDTLVCPICLVDIVKGDRVVKLDCDHLFHVGCISSWISRKAQCPACRFNIPTVITSCSTSARTSPRTVGRPSDVPSDVPSNVASARPSDVPFDVPSNVASARPSDVPFDVPSNGASGRPSDVPFDVPSNVASARPSDGEPEGEPIRLSNVQETTGSSSERPSTDP
jgi:hypothetical protein